MKEYSHCKKKGHSAVGWRVQIWSASPPKSHTAEQQADAAAQIVLDALLNECDLSSTTPSKLPLPLLPLSSGSRTVLGCNLASTCPDRPAEEEGGWARGVEGRNDGVDEGRGGVEGKRERLDLTEVWNRVRMEEGEGSRPEEIGEKEEQIKRVLISI